MRNALVAKVVVDQTAFHFDKPYDYLVPPALTEKIAAGSRVLVPFGKGNRKRQGIVLELSDTSDYEKVKPVAALLDARPLLNTEMLKLGAWLKEHTFCTYFDALKCLLPVGINLRMVTSYRIGAEVTPEQLAALPEDERRAAEYLYNSGAVVERERLLEVMGLSSDSALPESLVKKGILDRSDQAVRRVGDASVRMVQLTDPEQDFSEIKLSSKQKSVIELLQQAGGASLKEICYFTGVTPVVLTTLHKKGLVEFYEEEVYRTPYRQAGEVSDAPIVLTGEQQHAFDTLMKKYEEHTGAAALLYGVTGSGKTQVFLRLVDEAAKSGRGVIVMVPEIALTPQTLGVFHRRYGDKVAVFHSAMSLGQRMDEWKRVKNGDAQIAIGTRSAVFAPFEDIGLIIMDEEQEHTYKSESSPRFHARDVARFRAAYHKALLVLASATPAIETFSAALAGRYTLCRLANRYGAAFLPEVVTVDMKAELLDGNTGPVSRYLIESIGGALSERRQVILLLNRRGHNTYVSCRSCGHVMTCPHCSISMTYHSANGRLLCHYCGYSEEYQSTCPACGSEHMRYSGFGTQRVEQELASLFPDARVLRMDTDSTMTRHAYEKNLSAFGAGGYDIMLGTQMVAKGLNFPNVTLVGVLGADQSMYSDDYRSFERAFSLLTQVVGRSGRGDYPGTAVIQTIDPDSSVIRLAQAQDYDAFYEQEILTRRMMIYPPYCDLAMVGFIGEKADLVQNGAMRFFEILKRFTEGSFRDVRLIILGPSAASVPKVSNKYRWRMLIKCKNTPRFREMLRETLVQFGKGTYSKEVTAFVDMNPEGIL